MLSSIEINPHYMKKVVLIFSVLCVYMSFSSCLGDRCDLVGKWKVTEVSIQSERFSVSVKELIKNEYLSSTYEFLPDGIVNITSDTDSPRTSSYSLNLEENTISLNDDSARDAQASVNSIINCSDNVFTLEEKLGSGEGGNSASIITYTLERTE